jgi:transcriptional regulator with XRE-family HTH domain
MQYAARIGILDCTNASDPGVGVLHVAQRFERFLRTYRRPDGGRWGGADLERATGGVVTRSYVANLRKGRIVNPGYEKMRALAKAMGFPPALWFEEDLSGDGGPPMESEGSGIPVRLEHLFETLKNPRTGEPYTNAEVARMSAGVLTEGDVDGIRIGSIADPTVSQVAALAAAFGVPPSYLMDRGKDLGLLDEEALEALSDERAGTILRESGKLSDREKEIILGIVRQFAGERSEETGS